MKSMRGKRPAIRPAAAVATFLWPYFWEQHDCIFVSFTNDVPKFNAPPASDTATGWESFVNHTHIFDEFRNNATKRVVIGGDETLYEIEETYDETHPDFIAACELGKTAAKTWALKLQQDFPMHRFRVYYTELDNPIIRFHKVREQEELWLSDDGLKSASNPDFHNALIYDTENLLQPVLGPTCPLN